jgi:rhodanese-related sulfurtransferase
MKTFSRIIGVPGLTNLGVVAEGKVYRSAQPDYVGQNIGFRLNSILNLREKSEIELVEPALKYFQLRLNILSYVAAEDFDLIVQTLSNPDNQPILVHCQSGADRTGVACAVYRMAVDGWTLAEAWEELECYGGGVHDILNLKLKRHLASYAVVKGFK